MTKKYIVPPSHPVIPCERYNEGKWERIEFLEIKKGDLLRFYNHEMKIVELDTPNHVGRARDNGYLNEEGIPAVWIDTDNIPDL